MHNPWSDIDVPRVPIPLLKAPSPENVKELFSYLDNHYPPELALRNKTIIAVFVESGLRLFELSAIKLEDINWTESTLRVWGKGWKEGKAPFGQTSEALSAIRKALERDPDNAFYRQAHDFLQGKMAR